ncbi:unnamed protein product, partial [marine sediment metagenome]
TYHFTTGAVKPVLTNEQPTNGTTEADMYPTLSITVSDNQGDNFNITWSTNATDTWIMYNATCVNGTYRQTATWANQSNTTYWWNISVNDTGNHWTNATYHFKTANYSWSDWSGWWTFEYLVGYPPVFSNPNPANKSTNVPISTTTWNITIEDPEGDTFNWTIETSPDIGSNSSNDAGNGSKEVNITGNLSIGTNYTVYVNATDIGSKTWTNETFWFSTDTLYERYNTGDDGAERVYGSRFQGQTFTIGNTGANENHWITSVKLKVYREGSPGTFTVAIMEVDAEHKPTGDDLTNGTIDGNTLTTNSPGLWYEIILTPYKLSASTQYAIVGKAPDGNTDNCVWMRMDSSDPTYTGGAYVVSTDSGDSWTVASSWEYVFEEYGAVTLPPTQSNQKIWNATTKVEKSLNATAVGLYPTCFNVTINDLDGDKMNITLTSNESGSWLVVNQTSDGGLSNGTYSYYNTSWIDSYNTIYYISFNLTDGTDWTNETYHFTTNYIPYVSVRTALSCFLLSYWFYRRTICWQRDDGYSDTISSESSWYR